MIIGFDRRQSRIARSIQASAVVAAIRACEVIRLENAIIVGPLVLNSETAHRSVEILQSELEALTATFTVFEKSVRIVDSHIVKYLQVNDSSLKGGLYLVGSQIGGELSLARSSVAGTLDLTQARVTGETDMRDATVGMTLNAGACYFQKDVDARRIRVSGRLRLKRTIFGANADFSEAHLGSLTLSRAYIKHKICLRGVCCESDIFITRLRASTLDLYSTRADGDIIGRNIIVRNYLALVGTRVKGLVDLSRGVVFGDVCLNALRTGDDLVVRHTFISGDLELIAADIGDRLDCSQIEIGGDFRCDGIRIAGDVDLDGAMIRGNAQLISSVVSGDLMMNGIKVFGASHLDSMRIGQQVTAEGANFSRGCTFIFTDVGGDFYLSKSIFGGSATFSRMKVAGNFELIAARIETKTDIDHVRVGGEVRLWRASLGNELSFRGSTIQSLRFENIDPPDEMNEFRGRFLKTAIDLRGCVYDDFVAYYLDVLDALWPFDFQPYMQLEKYLNRIGRTDLGSIIYRRSQHDASKTRSIGSNVSRRVWGGIWGLAGYGAPSWTFNIVALLIIPLFAGYMFHQPGNTCHESAIRHICQRDGTLGWTDAILMGYKAYLPIELPVLQSLAPATHLSVLAAFLKIAGWILIPVVIAGLVRFLRRDASNLSSSDTGR